MNGVGDHFFANPAFAFNKNRYAGAGRLCSDGQRGACCGVPQFPFIRPQVSVFCSFD